MNKIYKNKIFLGALLALGFAFPLASMAASLNTAPNDLPTIQVANATINPSTSLVWANSTTATGGQMVSVQIYYHNTGFDAAQNVRLFLNVPTGAQTSMQITGQVTSANSNTASGSANISFTDGQAHTLTYNSIRWYPDQSSGLSRTSRALINGQTAANLFNGQGLLVGDVPVNDSSGQWTYSQGTIAVDFLVSNSAPTAVCPAQAVTNQPSGITTNSANFSGSFSPNPAGAYQTWFEYGTTQNFGQSTLQTSGSTQFSGSVNGLQQGTTYFVRSVVRSTDSNCSQNVINGSPVQFATQASQQQGSISPTTNSALNITQTSSLLNGSVASQGSAQTYEYWFEWGPGALTNSTMHQVGTGSVGASQNISGLSPDTSYNFRIVAQISGQSPQYGTTASFHTLANPVTQNNATLTATTFGASNLGQNSLTFNGSVNGVNTNNITAWFEYGTTVSLGYTTVPQNIGNGSYSAYQGGLVPATTYYYRAVARSNETGLAYGIIMSIQTPANQSYNYNYSNYYPYNYSYSNTYSYQQATLTATTNSATNVGQNSATLNGTIYNSNANNVVRWFEWGTTYSLGSRTSDQYQSYGSGNYSDSLSGLQSNTLYYYRAVARSNETGTVYGNIISFSTSVPIYSSAISYAFASPQYVSTSVYTNPATAVTLASAKLNANAILNNVQSSGWFEWGTSATLGQQTSPINLGSSSANNYFATIYGLTPRSLYYFRAVTQNTQGQIARGQILTFTTLGPSVTYKAPAVYKQPAPKTSVTLAEATYTKATGEVITKTADDLSFPCGTTTYVCARQGHTIQYTITVLNPSWSETSNAVVTDTLSPFFDFKNASEGGNYNAGTRTVQWSLQLRPREGHTFMIKVFAREIADNIVVTNNASMYIGGKTYKSNDTQVCITITPIAVEITADKATVSPNDTITYTVRYANVDGAPVGNLALRMSVPQGVTLAGSDKPNLSSQGGVVVVHVGGLNPKQSGTANLTFKVNANVSLDQPIVFAATASFADTQGTSQPDVSTYVNTPVTKSSTPLNSASVSGAVVTSAGGFLPTSLLGWLAFILLLLIVALILMRLWTDYRSSKGRPPEAV